MSDTEQSGFFLPSFSSEEPSWVKKTQRHILHVSIYADLAKLVASLAILIVQHPESGCNKLFQVFFILAFIVEFLFFLRRPSHSTNILFSIDTMFFLVYGVLLGCAIGLLHNGRSTCSKESVSYFTVLSLWVGFGLITLVSILAVPFVSLCYSYAVKIVAPVMQILAPVMYKLAPVMHKLTQMMHILVQTMRKLVPTKYQCAVKKHVHDNTYDFESLDDKQIDSSDLEEALPGDKSNLKTKKSSLFYRLVKLPVKRKFLVTQKDLDPCSICAEPLNNGKPIYTVQKVKLVTGLLYKPYTGDSTEPNNTECKHIHHSECIEGWFNLHNYTCPLCIRVVFKVNTSFQPEIEMV